MYFYTYLSNSANIIMINFKEVHIFAKKNNSMLNSYKTEDKVLLAVDCILFGFDKEDLKKLY